MFRPSPEHRNLLRLFETKDTSWESPSSEFSHDSLKWEFLDKTEREGTDEQREFVLKALNTPDFAILEGPPGSGKTTAISELIYQLLAREKRVLLCASTHVAVDNVLEKLEETFHGNGGPMGNGIVPLRIGRERSVSHDIQKYRMEERIETMKKRFCDEPWLRDVNEEKEDEYVENLVINTSNLVCGTTIGILQFPHFRPTKKGAYVIPEFDYLIIDEASKTTFQEFLVPAIYAKKWIIVGDVRQLSPYTDTLHVRVNLDGILKNSLKERAYVVFFKLLFERKDAKVNGRWIPPPNFIYADKASVIQELLYMLPGKIAEQEKRGKQHPRRLLKNFKLSFVTKQQNEMDQGNVDLIIEDLLMYKKSSLLGRNIVLVDEQVFKRKWNSFPHTHILISPNGRMRNHIHEFRHLHWYMTQGKGRHAYQISRGKSCEKPWEIKDEIMDALQKNWAGELSWRMKRVYELRLANKGKKGGGGQGYYLASMHALMPPSSKEHRETWYAIKKIGQVALTSILSSLQEGVTQYYRDEGDKTVMSHGLTEWVKDPRYTKLSYQHRMHPEISALPREIFYKGEALNDDTFVKRGGREWEYARYKEKVVWIDVGDAWVYRNENEKEARVVLKELAAFVRWAKRQKTKYNVVILSFYEKQRKKIRDLLREKYPQNAKRETRFTIEGIAVRNYTVDKVQGREGDIVLLSMVQNRRVGFMDSPNRLNVALTRAKYQLVIIGDKEYFYSQKNSAELSEIAERISVFSEKKARI